MAGFMTENLPWTAGAEVAQQAQPAGASSNWQPQALSFGDQPQIQQNQDNGGGMMQAGIQLGSGLASLAGAGAAAGGAASAAGSLASLGMGPAGIVIAPIVGKIFGALFGKEQKIPYATLSSRPLASGRGEFEGGGMIASKLANIGFGEQGTGNGFNPLESQDMVQGIVEADNALYNYMDDTARQAIQKNFKWDSVKNGVSETGIINRYGSMLKVAADAGSPKAQNAQQVIKDMTADYKRAYSAIDDNLPREAQKIIELGDKIKDTEAASANSNATLLENKKIVKLAAERRALAASLYDKGGAALDSAYIAYVDNGGVMSRDNFDNVFGGVIKGYAAGTDVGAENAKYNNNTDMESAYAAASGFQPTPEGIASFKNAQGITDTSSRVNIQDYLAYMVNGLAGRSYAQIVGGDNSTDLGLKGEQKPQWTAPGQTENQATRLINNWGGLGAGG